MGLNSTPSAERVYIGIFGKRNAGKSSIINALTGQNLAIVSGVRGTTTDPVSKAMELLPLGPVVIIDTPGIDDEGILGKLRVQKSYQVLNKTDIAVLVVDAQEGITREDEDLLKKIQEKAIPCIVVFNKEDLIEEKEVFENLQKLIKTKSNYIAVSAATGSNIHQLKEMLASSVPASESKEGLVREFLSPGDFVILVVPIDKAVPKGRLILPQQQTIRDILEGNAAAIVVKENELEKTLQEIGKKPRMVITDSQVFKEVAAIVPKDVPLTSFSILFARYKGELDTLIAGVKAMEEIEDGDKILISEGCTHHRQCDDIGTMKLPRWIRDYTGKEPEFIFTSGVEFPDDLSPYDFVIHCGGCMLNPREMKYRIACAKDAKVPITNYGILIAKINGILERSIQGLKIRK